MQHVDNHSHGFPPLKFTNRFTQVSSHIHVSLVVNHTVRLVVFVGTVVKLYTCNICGKSLTSSRNLIIHERLHVRVKPDAFSTRGKAFTLSENLKIPELIYTDVKPFVCCICGQSFTKLIHLKIHEMVHRV